MKKTACLFLLAIAAALPAAARGQQAPSLRLASIFNDGMVIQRDRPAKVWGWAPPGTAVIVTITEDEKHATSVAGAEALQREVPRSSKPADGSDAPPAVRVVYVQDSPPAFRTQTAKATAGSDGRWTATFPPMEASFTPKFLLAAAGDGHVAFRDILVGELWLAAGQSNMVWTNYFMSDLDANRDFPGIRYFAAEDSWYKPREDLPRQAKWVPVTPGVSISAVPYFFARYVHEYLKVPVGIMNVSRGGTTGQAWCLRELLDAIDAPTVKEGLQTYDAETATWETEQGRQKVLDAWRKETAAKKAEVVRRIEEAKKAGKTPPRWREPKPPGDPRSGWSPPAGLFNAMVWPLRHLAIRGVIYYQGENNYFKGRWVPYEHTFPAVIASFRKAFGDEELPFGIISLPGGGGGESPEEGAMAKSNVIVRDIHTRTHDKTPHTGLITTYDLGDGYIHPGDKRPVGERTARWALAMVYGKPMRHRGPKFKRMEIDGGKARLYWEPDPYIPVEYKRMFDKGDKPFWSLAPTPVAGGKDLYRGFVIAGADRRWHPAQVKPNNTELALEVWSDLVPEPVAVRYGWCGGRGYANATCNEDLPVPSFRTDDWPIPDGEQIVAARELAQKYAMDRQWQEAVRGLDALEGGLSRVDGDSFRKRRLEFKRDRLRKVVEEIESDWPAKDLKQHPSLAEKIAQLRTLVKGLDEEIGKIER